jgi:hypothetical protein
MCFGSGASQQLIFAGKSRRHTFDTLSWEFIFTRILSVTPISAFSAGMKLLQSIRCHVV